jgi:tetratricopeptide (TPR) repeat protein
LTDPAHDEVIAETEASNLESTIDAEAQQIIDDYQSAIDRLEALTGPFDPELSELTFALGKTLQRQNRLEEAIQAFHHAMYVNRVNNGVYSLTQEPMLRGIIDTNLPLGFISEAAEAYQKLLWLHRKTYGAIDARILPLLDEIGQWHLRAYNARGRRDDIYHLNIAHGVYNQALAITAQQHGDDHLSMTGLLYNSAMTDYYLDRHQKKYTNSWENKDLLSERFQQARWVADDPFLSKNYFQNGRRANAKMIDILEQNPTASTADKATGYIKTGDWLMLFNLTGPAIDAYQKAYRTLQQTNDTALITALLGEPKMLPRPIDSAIMETEPVVTDQTTSTERLPEQPEPSMPDSPEAGFSPPTPEAYVMLSVDISEKGQPQKITTLGVYPEGGDGMENRARKTIINTKFRPRFDNGQPVPTEALPVKVLIQ